MADLRWGHPAPPKIVKIKLNHSTPSGNHISARQRLLMGLLQTSLKIVMKLLLLFKYNHEKKYHRSLSLIYSFNLFSLIHFCLSKSLKIKELPGVYLHLRALPWTKWGPQCGPHTPCQQLVPSLILILYAPKNLFAFRPKAENCGSKGILQKLHALF